MTIGRKKKKSVGKGKRRKPRSTPKKKRGAGKAYEGVKRTSLAGKKRKDGIAKTRIGRNTINSNKAATMEQGTREVPLNQVALTTTATRRNEQPFLTQRTVELVHKYWAKYTEMWTRLMASAASKVKFQEIPWPISLSGKRLLILTNLFILNILFRINNESIRSFLLTPAQLQSMSSKARIRKELLRFHPDKRVLWLKNFKDEERDQVDEAC